MRLIDADALIDKYGDWYTEEGTEEGYIGTIKGIVDSMPTIEPERETGEWIHDGKAFAGGCDWMYCSVCGHMDIDVPNTRTNFCPNCGADMRGGEQNG